LLKPGLDQARQDAAGMAQSEEDVLTYALFPEIAKDYFLWRDSHQNSAQAVSNS
jgi:pyruvate carboxylase subunit B